jgi:hypothetical protein
MDRAAILLDAHALTSANLMDPADLMHLLSAYTAEDDSIVWDALAMVLAAVDKAVVGIDSVHSNFKKMAASIVDPAMARLGWEPKDTDSHLTKLMRSTVISLLARFSEDPTLREEARRRFEAVVEDPNNVAACPTDYRVRILRGKGKGTKFRFRIFRETEGGSRESGVTRPTYMKALISYLLPLALSLTPTIRLLCSPWWRQKVARRSTMNS